jgi:hypothetical protein
MILHAAQSLVAWGQLEDCPTLTTIRDFLRTVPHQPLLDGRIAARLRLCAAKVLLRPWSVMSLMASTLNSRGNRRRGFPMMDLLTKKLYTPF